MRPDRLSLVITTPTAVAATADDVRHLRAEDAAGAFGVLPGHADLLTALEISVVSWRGLDGRERHCAVRGGVLTVSGGAHVSIATRDAVIGDELETLERNVLTRFRSVHADEEEARAGARRLHVAAVRHILAYLRPDGRTDAPGRAPSDSGGGGDEGGRGGTE
ncbi:F0F1 ATP synthase subunit epsilon (plasmid) [Azospirillum brasilense]|uniref:ATP synthase epsilon chain n=1 Tax=Azospirillum brasilense TaxID=192 RepID=A0A4D8QQ15_AZOBR|nr:MULTISPECIES: F0F1 ATP synthase subunit epsilon [Azospirillum]MDW7554555.1 F0F1 ATP synthase subunit epsilon [Azospirillum brasilense]MDW7632285.1 F0F1 ATP synthase subunit epsilon [Azospirillum brasilense]MDX5950104.1 F0F1 ATP synthase subunit epsilon [Azospirillum brasilense]PWC89046.1 ATP synthase F0F1 subunit epsilon [Azospirillum sp. Sp 7]QCO12517.1 F0F1 ATP synthase subunit epsilon [Azospirillum brasilense]